MQTMKRMLRKCSHEAPPEIPPETIPWKKPRKKPSENNPRKKIQNSICILCYCSYFAIGFGISQGIRNLVQQLLSRSTRFD